MGLPDEQTRRIPTNVRKRGIMAIPLRLLSPFVRATRTILNHAPIGEYRARFRPQEPIPCSCGELDLETRTHTYRVPQVHRKPSDSTLPVLRRPHQVSYIQSHGICLHTTQRAPIALQRYCEYTPHSVPSLQLQTLTYGASFGHALLPSSSPAVCCLFSPIFFSASLLFCVCLLRLT